MLIDIHTHILPGLDDGVQSDEEALNTAKQALNQGITHIVATPHVNPSIYQYKPILIPAKVFVLQSALDEEKVAIRILPGAEYCLEPQLLLKLARGELLTINGCGKHLLVELPKLHLPDYAELLLFELQLNGLTPILAHPERNAILAQHPEKLENLVQRGILVQITAGSLTGLFGKEVMTASEVFVRRGMVHFIASDMHGHGKRLLAMADAKNKLKRLVGERKANRILLDNPLLVLKGERIAERDEFVC